eukprot:7382668-Prymnesium_polylepis.1
MLIEPECKMLCCPRRMICAPCQEAVVLSCRVPAQPSSRAAGHRTGSSMLVTIYSHTKVRQDSHLGSRMLLVGQ